MCLYKLFASPRTVYKVSCCIILAYVSEAQLQATIVRKAPHLRYILLMVGFTVWGLAYARLLP